MSAVTHRSLARLPVDLFQDLQHRPSASLESLDHLDGTPDLSAVDLRTLIISKLNQVLIPSQQASQRHARANDHLSAPPVPTPRIGVTTVGHLLQLLTPLSLVYTLDPILTYPECCELYRRICRYTAPKSVTGLALLHQTTTTAAPRDASTAPDGTSHLFETSRSTGHSAVVTGSMPLTSLPRHWPTGWPTLDAALRGGLRVGTVTEVVGAAGTGKTQLSMQLAVHTILGHHHSRSVQYDPNGATSPMQSGGGCIFIDTEQKISLSRLNEIAASTLMTTAAAAASASVASVNRNAFNVGYRALDQQDIMENISVHTPSSTTDLRQVLQSLEEEILTRNAKSASDSTPHNNQRMPGPRCLPVRLLVIDSIAAPLRRGSESTSNSSAASQAATVVQIAQTLKRLADQFQLVVCVINQVGSVYAAPSTSNDASLQTPVDSQLPLHQPVPEAALTSMRAALGTAWHHCVSTRIELRCGHPQQQQQHLHRYAQVVKSNVVGNSRPIPFQIAVQGITDAK